jgi:hypothetical protein
VNGWSHHWRDPATKEESDILGTFSWHPTPLLSQIETEAGFSLEDLLQELGQLELKALRYVTHGHPSGRMNS